MDGSIFQDEACLYKAEKESDKEEEEAKQLESMDQ